MVAIRVLGPLEIAGDGRTLGARDVGGIKPRQVLSILIVHRGRVVAKDRIADLLWGDSPPKNVPATLETYVSKLRKALDAVGAADLVVTEPGGYRIELANAELDLDAFDRLRASPRDLDAALALVRGEIFEEEVYATWAIRLRDDYRGKHLQVLLASAQAAAARGDHAIALDRANALLALDRTHEGGYRVALAALVALGSTDEAARLFERCKVALRDELGVKPSAALVAAYEARTTAVAPSRPAVPSRRELPFLGRTEELAALERALRGPAPALVLVEGEAGIGKTRLLDELVGRLERCVRAGCSPLDRELVFAPIATIVRSLAGDAARDQDRYPALGELVPELGASGLPPETARTRAFESFVQLVSEHAPITLVIDDLQWADPSTLAALAYLLRRATGVAVVASARSKELDHQQLRNMPPKLRLELAPLSRDLLAPYGADLFDRTGGNALFAAELVRAGGDARTLRELLIARCSAAGEHAHRTLAIASVLGRSFSPVVLARITDDTVDAVLVELDALCEHGLLAATADRFEFRHDLIREALYDSLSPPRRRRLHERAAAALDDAPPGVIAHHAAAAGSIELAVRSSLRAAELARRGWANVEAAEHYDRALRLAVAHPEILEPVALEALRVAFAHVLVTVGRWPDAEALLGAARATAEERGDERATFEILEALVYARHRGASAPTDALRHARSALAFAERIADPLVLSRAHTLVGGPLTSLGQLPQALEHCHAAIRHAEAAGHAPRAYPLGRIALTLHFQGADIDSLAWGSRAEAAALAQHDEETTVMVRWIRALSCTALGRYGEAIRALDAIRQVGRGEVVFWHARVPNTWGALYADLCLHDRALACDEQALESARQQAGGAVREAEMHTLLNIAQNRLALGQLDAAHRAIEEVRREVGEIEYARFRWLARMHAIAAELAAAQDDREGARQAADSCLALAEKYGQPRYEIRGKLARAAALGNTPGARSIARAAATQAEELGWPGLAWRGWLAAGDLARARRAVATCAEGLDEPLRSEFLSRVPVPR